MWRLRSLLPPTRRIENDVDTAPGGHAAEMLREYLRQRPKLAAEVLRDLRVLLEWHGGPYGWSRLDLLSRLPVLELVRSERGWQWSMFTGTSYRLDETHHPSKTIAASHADQAAVQSGWVLADSALPV